MNIFILILIFISFFLFILNWTRGNKAALIVSILLIILIVIFHKHIRLPRLFGDYETINSITESEFTSPFISSKWQDSILVHSDLPIRIGMIDDFIGHRNLYQLNKEEILHLLGKPDNNDELKEWDLVYWLGEEQLFVGSYTQWFAIEFDSSGMVSEYIIFRY